MHDFDRFEQRLAAALRSDADRSVGPFEAGSVARAAIVGTRPVRGFGRGRGITLLAAAALLLVGGALAAGSGVLWRPSVNPPVPAPSLTAIVVASPAATSPSPTKLASTSPGPTPVPITWTPASRHEDWPAPVRTEPAGVASVTPMPPTYIDPSGDTGSSAISYVDIRDVSADPDQVSFDLMSKPPDVDPSQTWIAYGVVVDEDRDGVPDWRYGIDNLPPTAGDGSGSHRAWRTDLHTGRTEFDPNPRTNAWGGRGDPLDQVGETRFGTGYPAGAFGTGPRFRFYYQADKTGGGMLTMGDKLDKPFYVWASAIADGQVVATDYAPDTGWLIPTPDRANPGGTAVVRGDLLGHRFPFRVSLNVPDGWTAGGPSVRPNTGEADLEFLIADHPAEWACDASGHAIKPPVGPSVDDLVTFLALQQRQQMITISDNTDVTLDGYRGKYLEYTTFWDENNNCQPAEWPFARSAFHEVWILDVDGVRLVIEASSPKASEAIKAEFRQIVDSIAIGP